MGFCGLWPHCSYPNDQVNSITAPAHPHATGVAVYPALLNCKLFLHYCPCPTIRDCLAVYPALLPLVNSITMCWVRYPLLAQLSRRFLFFYSFGNGKVDTGSFWRIHDFIAAVRRVMDWQSVSLWTAPILSCLYVRSNNQNA